MKTDPIKSFAEAESLVREVLKGTEFENAELVEYGGGDAPDDIKPLRIAEAGVYSFMAVGYPEGGIQFCITEDGDRYEVKEYEDFNEAISMWKVLSQKRAKTFKVRVMWTVGKTYEVDAKTADEAKKKIQKLVDEGNVCVWTDGYEATDDVKVTMPDVYCNGEK